MFRIFSCYPLHLPQPRLVCVVASQGVMSACHHHAASWAETRHLAAASVHQRAVRTTGHQSPVHLDTGARRRRAAVPRAYPARQLE